MNPTFEPLTVVEALYIITCTQNRGGYSHFFGRQLDDCPEIGFVVGNGKAGFILPGNVEPAFLAYLARSFYEKGAKGIGLWKANGNIYIDPIAWIQDKTEARLMGLAYGEKAYYSLATQVAYDCLTDKPYGE